MNTANSLAAAALFTLFALAPLAQAEDEELEVTMEILVDESAISDDINEIRGPSGQAFEVGHEDSAAGDNTLADEALDDAERERQEARFRGIEDDFEHDDVDDDLKDDIDEEDDFEEDEAVDDDGFDDDMDADLDGDESTS